MLSDELGSVHADKMLINVSTPRPTASYIRTETMGLAGHVCAFERFAGFL
jgi:hypothetical protein